MSFDLRVFTQSPPALEAPAIEGLRALAHPDGVELLRELSGGDRQLCTADGPFEIVEAEDEIPEAVRSGLLSVAWEVQISAGGVLSDRDVIAVNRFARAVAKSGDGMVFDPQLDKVVWPRSIRALRKVPARPAEADTYLAMEWAFVEELDSGRATHLINVLERHLPEASPRRFGTYEPLQGRSDRDGQDAFAELFEGPHTVSWKGKRPFEWGFAHPRRGWGSALTPDERAKRTPELGGRKGVRPTSIKLEFESGVAEEPRWTGAVRSLFRGVGEQLGPMYGIAWMARRQIREPGETLNGQWWLGIPDFPVWLTWVGHPYTDSLPADIEGDVSEDPGGVFVAHSPAPLDEAVQMENAIPWDHKLVRGGSQLEDENAAALIPPLMSELGPGRSSGAPLWTRSG